MEVNIVPQPLISSGEKEEDVSYELTFNPWHSVYGC